MINHLKIHRGRSTCTLTLVRRRQERLIRRDTPAACDANGGWETGEPPASNMERCDIDRRTRLTPDEWFQEYYMRGRPVLIQGALPLNERCGMSKAT